METVNLKDSKCVLFLQGPVGPFFSILAGELAANGITTRSFGVHRADRLFNRILPYQDSASSGDDIVDQLESALRQNFSAVVLFGSERPLHKIARSICRSKNIPVFSFEEGYIRPGYVTIEKGGNNGSSPLCALNLSELNEEDLPLETVHQSFNGFKSMAYYAACYYGLREVISSPHQRMFSHRNVDITDELRHWCLNGILRYFQGQGQTNWVRNFIALNAKNYYIVPLQVPCDANMQEPAAGWTTQRLITELISSLARQPSNTAHLIFKTHPMARGMHDESKLINQASADHNIAHRVHHIHTGPLGDLTKHARGMITINSSSGLSAIHHRVPLLHFGKAIYSHPELSKRYQTADDLDHFWRHPEVPNFECSQRFLRLIHRQALIKGDFYAPIGRSIAAKNASSVIIRELQN